MTTEIQFYHLISTPLERTLPKLLEKAYAGGFRVRVKARDEAQERMLNGALWTYDPDSFLPHGGPEDGHAAQQPIYITHRDEYPNKADLLVITDGTRVDTLEGVRKLLDIFDGNDEVETARARERWKAYIAAGYAPVYIRQNDQGGWDRQTVAA